MCKVYNSIGSLTAIKSHLLAHHINDFKSVKELIDFQKAYPEARQQIISDHSLLIDKEKDTLSAEIAQLNELIQQRKIDVEQHLRLELEELEQQLSSFQSDSHNGFRSILGFFKKARLKRKIRNNKRSFHGKVSHSVQQSTEALRYKNDRYQYVVNNFRDAVNESSWPHIQDLEHKKRVIDELNNTILGALGEQKVVKELENLPDQYTLINDFTCAFDPPIYNREENDHIRSIQIDHLLISPAGIFIIETKNWSEQSIKNLNLRSPVQQIRRTSFALFAVLANDIGNFRLGLTEHHWGARKIPVRNLIVMINQKPREEFQYVTILTLNELRSYIQYFPPTMSTGEIKTVTNYLLGRNGKRK